MKIILSFLCVLLQLNVYAGTPGINDVSLLYALFLLIIGGLAGIGIIVNWSRKKWDNTMVEPTSDQEVDDNDFFSQTGV